MPGRLESVITRSRLPRRLKTIAGVLATFAADGVIHASIRRVADRWGRSERRAQAALSDLRALGVLVVVRPRAPGRPTAYRFNVDRLARVPAPAPRGDRR